MYLGDAGGVVPDSAEAIRKGDEGEVARLLDRDPTLVNRTIRGYGPLAVAAAYGQLAMARLLAQRGADVNEVTREGRTALHWAADGGHQEVTAFLLSKNARADHVDHDSMTPLQLACEGGHAGVVRMLLHYIWGEGEEAGIQAATTALHGVAREGNAQVAKTLLDNGAQANTQDTIGRTPLIQASIWGHLCVVQTLLQYMDGNGLEKKDSSGHTALYYAILGGHEEVVARLLDKGAQAKSSQPGDVKETNLVTAAKRGHLAIVKMLVQHMGGQGLDDKDRGGRTALYHAAVNGHEEIVAFLLSKGAQATSSNEGDRTVLMESSGNGDLSMVQLLLQYTGGEGLEERDRWGHTALYYAAREGHEELVDFMLSKGALANSRDRKGRTVLMGASSGGHLGVMEMLLPYTGEGSLAETDSKGRTALHHAARGGHDKAVGFLLKKGAQANIRDHEGRTALVEASMCGHLRVVRVLVQHMGRHGLNERDSSYGSTPLHWAIIGGYQEMVRLLLVAGADPTVTDNQGRTPRALAESQHMMIGGIRQRHEEEKRQAIRAVFQVSLIHMLNSSSK
jgi:ankyrin repeat protein